MLGMAQQMEDALDDELHKMNNMTEDDLEDIRRKRLEAMKAGQTKRKEWLAKGHGELRSLADEKEFFAEMKGEDKMVVHFYRNNWPCKVMDMHLDLLSKKHLETKFARIDAEKSPFLTERLKIWMLPTLALISKEKVLDYVVGFDDLGGTDDFPTEHLRLCLAAKGKYAQLRGRRRGIGRQPAGAEEGDDGDREEEPSQGRRDLGARVGGRDQRLLRLSVRRPYCGSNISMQL